MLHSGSEGQIPKSISLGIKKHNNPPSDESSPNISVMPKVPKTLEIAEPDITHSDSTSPIADIRVAMVITNPHDQFHYHNAMNNIVMR
jgi:hypothetical protein